MRQLPGTTDVGRVIGYLFVVESDFGQERAVVETVEVRAQQDIDNGSGRAAETIPGLGYPFTVRRAMYPVTMSGANVGTVAAVLGWLSAEQVAVGVPLAASAALAAVRARTRVRVAREHRAAMESVARQFAVGGRPVRAEQRGGGARWSLELGSAADDNPAAGGEQVR